jgi:hypothetical protein
VNYLKGGEASFVLETITAIFGDDIMKIILNKIERTHYNRKLRTANLVQYCYWQYCSGRKLTPNKLHSLCRLTWFDDYWQTNILPAQWILLGKKTEIPELLKPDELKNYGFPQNIISLVDEGTGFTNFYHVYRNSSAQWIKKNFSRISPLVHSVAKLETDYDARDIIEVIDELPGIPRPNDRKVKSNPSNLLTPLFSCLDPRIRFPVINQAEHVKILHRKLGISNESLPDKFDTLIGLINQHGIKDTLMLDTCSGKVTKIATKYISISHTKKEKPVTRPLSFKDDSDVETIIKSSNRKLTRLHNKMTNRLLSLCYKAGYKVLEGNEHNKYDACILNYNNKKRDLLIEVKSSTIRSHLRLAVGQLFDYRIKLKRKAVTDVAVLLPMKPDHDTYYFLNYIGINVLWFRNSKLSGIDDDSVIKFD